MRLTDKPYPGEPVEIAAVYDVVVLPHSDQCEVLTHNCDRATMPDSTPLGYDFACPDWRERLGRAMERIRAVADGPVRDEMESEIARAHSECAEILREEFGIEEGER